MIHNNFFKLLLTTLTVSFLLASSISFAQATDAAIRGETDYMRDCANCHSTSPQSNANKILNGVDWQVSRNAITNNVGGMGFLTNSDSSLQDIAAYLRGDTVTDTTGTTVPTSSISTQKPLLYDNEPFVIEFEVGSDQSGDLYLATFYAGQLYFLTNDAERITTAPASILQNATAETAASLAWGYDTTGLPDGSYQFYQVLAQAGSDPLDANNWVGGSINRLNFALRVPAATVHDADNNFFYDDDMNKDGFHDDDLDFDGYHDDDLDKDGYHDDDTDKDGLHGVSSGPKAGEAFYIATCSRAGCHASDPTRDGTYLWNARNNPTAILRANQQNKGGMGYLLNIMTDQDYQNVADYLGSL